MKKQLIKLITAALCLLISVPAYCLSVSAENISRITVLGDSISEGYGLNDGEKNYGEWLGEYFGAEVSNFAVSGKTTQQLIDQLNDNGEVIESVREADLICVSIGGNDLLDFFFNDFYKASQNFGSSSGGGLGLSPEAVENMIVSIATAIGPASVAAGENTVAIADRLIELNPGAKIVMQTVYNPFEADNPDFKDMLPPLYTFASIYLASVNRPMVNNKKILCADIQKKFKGLCPYLTNMNSLDIHPNRQGHIVIAEEIVQLLKILGEHSIFENAFGDMPVGTPEDIPRLLRDETEKLSAGQFRIGGIPAETTAAKTTLKKHTETTETIIKEASAEKNDITKNKADSAAAAVMFPALIISSVILLAIPMLVITAILKKNKKNGEK